MSDETFCFDYELPRDLVAQEPLQHRADARLMIVNRASGEIGHHHVRDLPYLLAQGDRLVLNDTRVVPAALFGKRTETGGKWQGLFLRIDERGHWTILSKTRGRLSTGDTVTLWDREGRPSIQLRFIEPLSDGQWLVHPESESPTEELLEQVGRVPLPPYIRGGRMVDADAINYQTVFARQPGAVAAPTAGLHFTKDLLSLVKQYGMELSAVTLHVGLGTFRPIETETLDEHPMHSEWGEISTTTAEELNATRESGHRRIAVGTTVVRVLETAVRAAEKNSADTEISSPQIHPWQGDTSLFIRPPFEFRAVDALLTNFHFPRTTLLVLVQTFGGRELIERAYREAVAEEYRFYSYGDAMLIV